MPTIKLDDDNEDWLRTVRIERLKQQGWQGTLAEWVEAEEMLGVDPLKHEPPFTSLAAAKKR